MTRKFSEVLEKYLQERDRQNSDYYDWCAIGDRLAGQYDMEHWAKEMDKMVQGVAE